MHALEPTKVGAGLASAGTIPRQLVFGWIDKQALVVQVGGHDSSDEVIAMFADAFGDVYRRIKVVEVLGVPQRPLGVVSIGPVCAVSHAT
ncbi:MAG: hypothetical protein WCF10_07225 [Polyangiales bacterium]